jgi:hypothetical protein
MTDVKHTPGPWITNSFGTQVLTGDSWNTVCEIYTSKDHRLASWEDGRAATSVEANARLIAAAPDMLWALKRNRDQLCEGFCRDLPKAGTYTPEMDDLCGGCLARSVIAKASGETP